MNDCQRQGGLLKGTRKFVKIMVVSTILTMVIVILQVCIHVSKLIKMCTADICSVYVKNGLLQINCVSLKQSLCVDGTGVGIQGCLRARQAFSRCATFLAQINKAVFKKNDL